MITAIVIMQVLTLLFIAAYAIWRWRFRFDVQRIADVMAADLMEKYQEDIQQLSEQGVKDYARKRYIQLAATFGLPSAPADKVGLMVWDVIANSQPEQMQRVEGTAIYE